MFDWISKIVEAISNSIGNMVSFLGTQLANAIFDAILKWFYEMIYNAVADFFTEMGKMGAEMFDLSWVQATVTLFTYFGWALFAAGTVVAIFDVAVEYQSGRANIKTASINVIKGFFACSLIGIVPIELYKFCIALQNTFAHGLTGLMVSGKTVDLSGESTSVLEGCFKVSAQTTFNLFNILCLIAFAYCVVKIVTTSGKYDKYERVLNINGKKFKTISELVSYLNLLVSYSYERFVNFTNLITNKSNDLNPQFEAWLIAIGKRDELTKWFNSIK